MDIFKVPIPDSVWCWDQQTALAQAEHRLGERKGWPLRYLLEPERCLRLLSFDVDAEVVNAIQLRVHSLQVALQLVSLPKKPKHQASWRIRGLGHFSGFWCPRFWPCTVWPYMSPKQFQQGKTSVSFRIALCPFLNNRSGKTRHHTFPFKLSFVWTFARG